ncbi:MAG: exopolysaccharide biosynthesis polyprenyl glycosylphosphotransferase [Nitrospiraceae bacterium]|nr:exopolysaccharide biosynthesis polyprenyl glycosylphosphotransferase [Nitrospiraceae bacterium]
MDAAYLLSAYLFAVALIRPTGTSGLDYAVTHSGYYVILVVFWFCEAMDRGLWESARTEEVGTYLFAMLRALVGAMVVSVFIMAFFATPGLQHRFLAVFYLAAIVFVLLFRFVVQITVMVLRAGGYNHQRVLVVGANERTARLVEIMKGRPFHGYLVVGFLESDADRIHILESLGARHLGGFEALHSVLDDKQIDEVYVSLPVRTHYETIRRVKNVCATDNVLAHLIADPVPLRIARRQLRHLGDVPLLSLSAVPEAQAALFVKHTLDFVLTAGLLVMLSPFLALFALLIKLESPGPVFFLQERVGCNKRRFKMIKFRSMRADAEEMRSELEELNEQDGPVFKIRNDPRVTKVGHFIRKYSIDELPQLFNVLMGHMSLVGPRPPLPSEVERYTWNQRRRLSVKPGMTGLWQVSGRNSIDFERWVELDLQYIDTWSLWQDFRILLRTFGAVKDGC